MEDTARLAPLLWIREPIRLTLGCMRKWLPLTSVALGAFMLLVDVSIVNVALPSMATDLHATFTGCNG
jgi:hypothetical protein